MPNPIDILSPLDGRYRDRIEPLVPYFSERATILERARIELAYLKALADRIGNPLTDEEHAAVAKIMEDLAANDAEISIVKTIDAKIRHDTKAIEYYLREKFARAGLSARIPLLHFGLTSADVDTLAFTVNFRDFLSEIFMPKLASVRDALAERAASWVRIPMLGRTHGQPAVPTTLGKEIANFAVRLNRVIEDLRQLRFHGKLNGAIGNFNAHVAAFPDIDWIAFSEDFVSSLGLEPVLATTQIPPYDRLIAAFDRIRLVNSILVGFAQDMWRYAAAGYLRVAVNAAHVGSSTMPQKVNPIDFEMAESTCASSNALLEHLSHRLPINRLQRDLTDKYLLRDVGPAMAYSFLGIDAVHRGIETLSPDEAAMHRDLDAHWEVIGEGIQTILRAAGRDDAYEKMKAAMMGRTLTKDTVGEIIDKLDVPEDVKSKLRALSPFTYLGEAVKLTELALAEIGR